jgi:hypothetical protein
MASTRRPWFRISDTGDLRTIAKAYVVGGIITSDQDLSATSRVSGLLSRLRRLLGPTRSKVVSWEYPAAIGRLNRTYSDTDLAAMFDEATAKRDATGMDPWSTALRLEVPVSTSGTPKIGGVTGISLKNIFAVLGFGAAKIFPTGFPISLTFAAAEPRGIFQFDWPLRIGTSSLDMERGLAAERGYTALVDPQAEPDIIDLVWNRPPWQQGMKIGDKSAVAISGYNPYTLGKSEWRHLAKLGPVIVSGFDPTSMGRWYDEFAIALSHDLRFDVAAFQVWNAARRDAVDSSAPPVLIAWPGAFDQARLSRLVKPTIRRLKSQPSEFRVSIPRDVAKSLDMPRKLSAPTLAQRLEESIFGDEPNNAFFSEEDGGKMLSAIRPQIRQAETLEPEHRMSAVNDEAKVAADAESELDADQPAKDKDHESRDPDRADDRKVNAWFVDARPPLQQRRVYQLGVNIGKPREDALATASAPAIDWGDKENLQLLVVISGFGFVADQRQQILTLPKRGDSDTIFFAVTPNQDSMLLRISLYLARELTLLEEFELPIEVYSAIKAA